MASDHRGNRPRITAPVPVPKDKDERAGHPSPKPERPAAIRIVAAPLAVYIVPGALFESVIRLCALRFIFKHSLALQPH
jgi:hypothetical protein